MSLSFKNIVLETVGKSSNVALIRLNRPKALNALNDETFHEINAALAHVSQDDSQHVVVLTGSKKAFAAGADIKEMQPQTLASAFKKDMLGHWSKLYQFQKPTIAAVSGYALGGGCELAMMCDIIYASNSAVFGQPEINLGVIPGGGGSQRLLRAIGKSRTMELILTGKNWSAQEASDWGLISKVVPGEGEEVLDEAIKTAEAIASKGQLAVVAAKDTVKQAEELSLSQGLLYEKRLFHSLFATADQKEGMGAFAEKRKPTWTHS